MKTFSSLRAKRSNPEFLSLCVARLLDLRICAGAFAEAEGGLPRFARNDDEARGRAFAIPLSNVRGMSPGKWGGDLGSLRIYFLFLVIASQAKQSRECAGLTSFACGESGQSPRRCKLCNDNGGCICRCLPTCHAELVSASGSHEIPK